MGSLRRLVHGYNERDCEFDCANSLACMLLTFFCQEKGGRCATHKLFRRSMYVINLICHVLTLKDIRAT